MERITDPTLHYALCARNAKQMKQVSLNSMFHYQMVMGAYSLHFIFKDKDYRKAVHWLETLRLRRAKILESGYKVRHIFESSCLTRALTLLPDWHSS